MNHELSEIFACRSCYSADLRTVMDFGEQYLSGVFPESREAGERDCIKAPLNLVLCRNCWLVQLKHVVSPDALYRTFWYKSGITHSMIRTLATIATEAETFVGLKMGDAVCDIGANDGTLLRAYRTTGVSRVGYEPARNLFTEASAGGNTIIDDYFHASAPAKDRYKIITAIAMFYDLDNPNNFLSDVASVLHPDGVFIIQMNYLLTMIQQCAFDNICAEHLCYYSMTSLLPLLERHGLHVIRAEMNDVNGGSAQIWCRKVKSGSRPESVEAMLGYEQVMGLNAIDSYSHFAARVKKVGVRLNELLLGRGREKTYICGASTRGNTILQTFGIGTDRIAAAGERDTRKIGRVTPGTWIPIVSEDEMRAKAERLLVLPWHFADEITARERDFINRGGELIFPLPAPRVFKAQGVPV